MPKSEDARTYEKLLAAGVGLEVWDLKDCRTRGSNKKHDDNVEPVSSRNSNLFSRMDGCKIRASFVARP